MTTNDTSRPNSRHCPRCDAPGILPLEQPADEWGRIQDPVLLCPYCLAEFRAEGVTWLGAVPVPDPHDDGVEELAESLSDFFFGPEDEDEPLGAPFEAESWTELLPELESRLALLQGRPRWFLVLDATGDEDLFVQFAVDGEGTIRAEAAAARTAWDTERRRHDPAIDAELVRLGWNAPTDDPLEIAGPSGRPNFWRDLQVGPSAAPLLAELGVRTLVEAFGLEEPRQLVPCAGEAAWDDGPPPGSNVAAGRDRPSARTC
ncbi:MAG: TY-Chap domain-containing protein [Acidimicrobiales bacterium]